MLSYQKDYSISFCTTCMNRTIHLNQTYIKNIETAYKFRCNCEFILLNYNSKDNLDEWVKDNLGLWIERGYVRYYKATEPIYFHASHSKNIAHLLGCKELLCNIDADNFLTEDYLDKLYRIFRKDKNYLTYGTSSASRRLCIHRDNFYKINGYDEQLIGCAYEDKNFILRAKKIGIKTYKIKSNKFIEHSDEIRTALYDPKLTHKMLTQTFEEEFILKNEEILKSRHPHIFGSIKYNTWKTKKNINSEQIIANIGNEWGQARLIDWNGKETYVTHSG